MMKEYVSSEWIKHKRTFAIKLVILAPVITLLMNVFAPMWYQQNALVCFAFPWISHFDLHDV